MIKKTFKEDFFNQFGEESFRGYTLEQCNLIWNFFEPHLKLKKDPKPKIEIPQDKILEFNMMWPETKLPTGKYGRCSILEMNSAFQFFFKSFPECTDWEILMKAAEAYLNEREVENWNYTRRAKYFIRREAKDKSWESELSEYYERVRDGIQDIPQDQIRWEPKVY